MTFHLELPAATAANMHCGAMRLFLGLAVANICLATAVPGARLANAFQKRALTPDNSCGNKGGGANKGYTCDPKLARGGPCCSSSGWCGTTEAYCGTGCQPAFGTCGTTTSGAPLASTSTPPASTNTNTFQCGPQFGSQICANTYCCSVNGYCGKSDAYCGTGCQKAFGSCGTAPPPPAASGLVVSPDNTCGAGTRYICQQGQCCSSGGYCGVGNDYCADPGCQDPYGACDSSKTPAGAPTANDPRPRLGSVSYADDLFECKKAKTVALTFDDGPHAQYTGELLDILKRYGFTATFFVTGNNLGKGAIDTAAPFPGLLRRMIAEGHQVASHTWSHYNLTAANQTQRVSQMAKNERAVANVLGCYPTYMRPPYSECTQASGCWADMQRLGYHRTYFDLDTSDYLNTAPALIKNSQDKVQRLLAALPPAGDALAIQHDIHATSVQTLSPYFFDRIREKGWKGVTVGECLNDPPVNWYRKPGTGTGVNPYVTRATTTAKPTTTTKSAVNPELALEEGNGLADSDVQTAT